MKRVTICLLCLLAVAPSSFAGEKLPADLALVPADGLFFLHVRLQDVYHSDHFKEWRETLRLAGDKALAAFDSRFSPAPFSLDRLTVIVPKNSFEPIFVLSTTRPIDRAAFLRQTIPGYQEEKASPESMTLYLYPRKNLAFCIPSDNVLVAGSPEAVRNFKTQPRAKKGNLSEPLKQAQSGVAAVLAVNLEAIPAPIMSVMVKQGPPPLWPLLEPASKAKLATAVMDLRKQGRLDVQVAFADAKLAADGEQAAREGIKMLREFIGQKRNELKTRVNNGPDLDRLPDAAINTFALGMLNRFDDYLAAGPIKKNGNALVLSVPIPKDSQAALLASAASLGLLEIASNRNAPFSTPKVAERPARPAMTASQAQSSNNLKQIALAMHSYHDVYKAFPAAAICDKKTGKPLLSWRVAILPYIEELPLYNEFKLDEPWDSAHNKKLIARMPKVYTVPVETKTPEGETHYLVFVGEDKDPNSRTAFEMNKGFRLTEFTDGTSNTILVTEAGKSVPWTKPEDIPYDAKKPLPKPADLHGRGTFLVAAADGATHLLRGSIPEAMMRALITRDGGEVAGFFDDD